MKRMELMQRYLEQKHRTTLVHEQYLNTQREYAPAPLCICGRFISLWRWGRTARPRSAAWRKSWR